MATPEPWENATPIFGIRYPKPNAPATKLPDAFGHIGIDVETALQAASIPPVINAAIMVAPSAAARDAYWGVPASEADRLILQARGATTIRPDTGGTERYFADRTPPGWYRVDTNMPEPVTAIATGSQTITATAFAGLPISPVAVTLTLDAACWVDLDLGAWVVASASDVRVGIAVSGATVSVPSAPTWGAVAIASAAASTPIRPRKTLRLEAGVNTVAVQAYRSAATGAQTVSYPVLTATPLRWAA